MWLVCKSANMCIPMLCRMQLCVLGSDGVKKCMPLGQSLWTRTCLSGVQLGNVATGRPGRAAGHVLTIYNGSLNSPCCAIILSVM